jgi:Zn-dependent membrane protease YugP|tara:strand:+ start:1865 stop:2548 length:684 start_codon:yes stop_codon:yes gene_type:complete
MAYLIIIVVTIALILGPGIWVNRVLAKYSQPADRYAGTGASLARHLLDFNGLQSVVVESTESGDHYDPIAKAVRLTPDKHDGQSLTAITVAAHEVGHALQDHHGYAPLKWRTRLVRIMSKIEKIGAGLLVISPFIGLLTRVPALGIITILAGFMTLGSSVIVHGLTLPTEFDASFNRALPLLDKLNTLKPADRPHARRLLTAAALTYVSASLMSLLNIARWIAILRR